VPQVYLADAAGGRMRRLAGFAKIELEPGEARQVEVPLEWRTIAEWQDDGWTVAPGRYRFVLAPDALADGPAARSSCRGRRIAK
jgi:beta-glucosidase